MDFIGATMQLSTRSHLSSYAATDCVKFVFFTNSSAELGADGLLVKLKQRKITKRWTHLINKDN